MPLLWTSGSKGGFQLLVFLSALEVMGKSSVEYILKRVGGQFNYNLCSYYYLTKQLDTFEVIKKNSKKMMIDSGAHSFQKGVKVNWEEYTRDYADWIEQNDEDKILGYFEMDIDPAGYSYDLVLKLRKILLSKSNKIIPVWHKGRGISDFYDMCNNPIHKDKIIAITGFKNQDIKDSDYIKFVNYAHKRGVKVHCLGMTRENVMDKVPFDYVDSSSWKMNAIFGKYKGKKVPKSMKLNKGNLIESYAGNYEQGMKMQGKYFMKWNRYLERIREGV